MIVRILFTLFLASSLFPTVETVAQSRRRSASPHIVKGEVGVKANELVSRYAMYGLSGTVLIVQNDQIVFHKAFGLADMERKRPNTLDTIYDAGSIAKTFTATAILQLESAGKLKTDDAISRYLGEFPPDKPITIHQLLSHTSGLKLDAQDVGITPITPPDEFLIKVKEAPLLSPPGEKYSYSNLGYGLLAIIIERVSGENWHAYVRKNILKPAGLSQTMLYGDTSEKLAHGYFGNDDDDLQLEEPLRLARPDSYVWRKYSIGAGGIFSTTGDLYKWWRALHSWKVLTDEARRKMFSLQAIEQGYGWNIHKRPDAPERIYRGGLRGSFQSMLGYYPQQNTLLIYALNKNVANAQWASVLWTNLEKLIAGKPYVVPPAILTVNPANMDRYAGNYVLPSGDGFTVWREKNSLMIGAIGQSAVDRVAYPEQVPPSFQTEVGDAGKDVIAALVKGDSSKLTNGLLTEKDASALRTKWESWMNTIGGLRSYQLLGVSPGSGGNPRAFIKLNGEKSSLVVRLLFIWNEKRLIAWGDNIAMPAIAKLRPQSDSSFVNFDFQTSRTFRIRFQTSASGQVEGVAIPAADGKTHVFARATSNAVNGTQPEIAATYKPKSEGSPTVNPPRKPASDSRFAEYVGQFDTPRGVVTLTQEGETLIGDAGGSRMEFAPDDSTKDRFWARSGSASLTFDRDSNGKVVGVTLRLGQGGVLKGKKIN